SAVPPSAVRFRLPSRKREGSGVGVSAGAKGSDGPTPSPSRLREGVLGRAWQGEPRTALCRVRADACEQARVGVEQAVPTLGFVRRGAHVGEVAVAEAGGGMGSAGFGGP